MRPEKRDEYLRLHAAVWPQVEERLTASNITNYSIFIRDDLPVAHFEYRGGDFDSADADADADELWHVDQTSELSGAKAHVTTHQDLFDIKYIGCLCSTCAPKENFLSEILALETSDVRFPTSASLDGSDAMNADPDYSAAYVRIVTDAADGLEGHGFVFTIGRGNDVQQGAIAALESSLVGRNVEELLASMGQTWRDLVYDSQLRWLGPEKGVMHMAIGAVVNALWDLKAKRVGLPLWLLLCRMTPEQLVELVDFRYLTDALSREQALEILQRAATGREERIAQLHARGYPAYTTTPGWLGYDDDKLRRLCHEAVADGFTQIKLKVGADLDDDLRRLKIARDTVGPNIRIAVDANQRWDVPVAVDWIKALAPFDVAWVEEPTSPDDVLGHATISQAVSPVRIATGEHMANRVMFKQFLQAGALQVLQIDATRVAGVNENIAILLLAARFGVPVCPHAGGVGLCELVQHLSMFDAVAVSGSIEGRMIEFVDHLHEHFVTPVDVHGGRYWPPVAPGSGAEMIETSRREHLHARFTPSQRHYVGVAGASVEALGSGAGLLHG